MTALAAQISSGSASPSSLRAMLEVVKDRGTIIDIRSAGRHLLGVAINPDLPGQATVTMNNGWAAAAVGVIDNLVELPGDTPAAAVLRLIRDHGPKAMARLRGVFSVVVSDGINAWCGRDHVGLEPLFFASTQSELLVASELKQILAGTKDVAKPDLETVHSIFYGEPYDEARTAFQGLSRLAKGSYLEWSPGGMRTERYWYPEEVLESVKYGFGELQERFDQLMAQAVGRMLTGNDAVSLSGGIDSPAIAAYGASQHLAIEGRRLGAISAVYPDHPSVNEADLIEIVAKELDLDLHTYQPEPLHLDHLQDWVRVFDGPWSAWHPGASEQGYLQVRKYGYRTMLTGAYAEQVVDATHGLVAHLLWNRRFTAAQHALAVQRRHGASRVSSARVVAGALMPRPVAALRRYRHPLAIIPGWMDERRIRARGARTAMSARETWRRGQLSFLGLATSATEAYGMLQARHGIRVRHPWTDVDLWEFWLSLPAQVKHPDTRTKTLLRRLLRGRVPDAILDRRKTVFNAYITDRIDYPALRRWLVNPSIRIEGIDYRMLAGRLEAGDMAMSEFMWAKDLATAHAFLDLW